MTSEIRTRVLVSDIMFLLSHISPLVDRRTRVLGSRLPQDFPPYTVIVFLLVLQFFPSLLYGSPKSPFFQVTVEPLLLPLIGRLGSWELRLTDYKRSQSKTDHLPRLSVSTTSTPTTWFSRLGPVSTVMSPSFTFTPLLSLRSFSVLPD